MAFDATYLSKTLCQMTLNQTRGLVGGCWAHDSPGNAFLSLEDGDLDVGGVPKAEMIHHFLVWDPCAKRKAPLAVCSVPLSKGFADKAVETSRGNYEMLRLVGQVLVQNDDCIAGLCFDAHGSHAWIRNILHGQLHAIPDVSVLQSLPWFKDLTFLEMPKHNLPRLPVKIAMHGDSPVWGLCGPCDSDYFGS